MEKTYEITGLKCQGCVDTVTEKLSTLKSVENVFVNLDAKKVTITGRPLKWSLQRALKGTKFEIGQEIKNND
ncbi:heavy-metal-associated domain-containing protein [Streptococcus marimammalium]|uniref:heavy-metal-associated domain-containing protein n=1 Tax=Streptococcus marimammalium TaxID=269666 RepID=UPI00036334D1|nr:heavy-metal-associated domain-containing protein [Streptococcus marimammalium]